jgi:hypothetical protein
MTWIWNTVGFFLSYMTIVWFLNYFSLIVIRSINLVTESVITLKPKEHHYERSRLLFDIRIPTINLYIDSEQISDILDFIKFQNYTTIYGIKIIKLYFQHLYYFRKRSMSWISWSIIARIIWHWRIHTRTETTHSSNLLLIK